MIWALTAVYFLLVSGMLWLSFWFYGRTLMSIGKTKCIIKSFLGGGVYALFACMLVAPFFIAFGFIIPWREEFNANYLYMIYFVLLYFLAVVPGACCFRKRYLGELKKLGYFTR